MNKLEPVNVLLLDLDGTVRKSKTGKFIKNCDDIELYNEHVIPIMEFYKEKGFEIFAVSNQGGIAYGIKTYEQVQKEMSYTQKMCKGMFTEILFSPYDPAGTVPEYSIKTWTRKPDIGMMVFIADSLHKSGKCVDKLIMVGDRDEDEQFAKNITADFARSDFFFVDLEEHKKLYSFFMDEEY